MRSLRSLFVRSPQAATSVQDINVLRASCARSSDRELRETVHRSASSLAQVIAATAVVASRVLGTEIEMHDEQLQASVALAAGQIVEMQTGEGKTLAAVPAVVWQARGHDGVHVLTANYYRAYRADVTYATANEVGFDYLRDGLALDESELVHRPFGQVSAVIDEVDSILIDEARIPLVIAGGASDRSSLPAHADRAARELLPIHHYTIESGGRQVLLTPVGVRHVEHALGVPNLFDDDARDA